MDSSLWLPDESTNQGEKLRPEVCAYLTYSDGRWGLDDAPQWPTQAKFICEIPGTDKMVLTCTLYCRSLRTKKNEQVYLVTKYEFSNKSQ